MIFKYSQYRQFLKDINRLGKTMLFRDWKGENVFLLRHDVDFDISLAHNLAIIEKEENVLSTYFILTTSYTYNILSEKNKKMLLEIKDMGHEIGLHFNPTIYKNDFEYAFRKEVEILSFAINQEIKSISLHNPSVHGMYPIFDGYSNAYDPIFFSDSNYISDSCFSFRNKNPLNFIKEIEKKMIQICLHPMHYSENGLAYDDIVINSFIKYMNDVHTNFLSNITYAKQVEFDFISMLKKKLNNY